MAESKERVAPTLHSMSVADIFTAIHEADALLLAVENAQRLLDLGGNILQLGRAEIDVIRLHLAKCYIITHHEGDVRERFHHALAYLENLSSSLPEPRRSTRALVPKQGSSEDEGAPVRATGRGRGRGRGRTSGRGTRGRRGRGRGTRGRPRKIKAVEHLSDDEPEERAVKRSRASAYSDDDGSDDPEVEERGIRAGQRMQSFNHLLGAAVHMEQNGPVHGEEDGDDLDDYADGDDGAFDDENGGHHEQ